MSAERDRYDELLAEFLDGELDPAGQDELGRILRQSPELAAEACDLAAQAGDLDVLLSEGSSPESLREAIRTALIAKENGARFVARVRERLSGPSLARQRAFGLAAAFAVLLAVAVPVALDRVSEIRPPRVVRYAGAGELVPGSHPIEVEVEDLSGRPAPGSLVRVRLEGPRGDVLAEGSGESDAQGRAAVPLEVPAQGEGCVLVVEGEAAFPWGSPATRALVRIRRPYRIYLTGDRPIYQPGQTVLFRALVLSSETGRPVAGDRISFDVHDPKGNRILHQAATLERGGVSAGSLPLSRLLETGTYRLSATVGGAVETRAFEVSEYTLPPFTVEIRTERDSYEPGERIRGTVAAWYTYGEPVLGTAKLAMPREALSGSLDERGEFAFEATAPSGDLVLVARVEDRGGRTETAERVLAIGTGPVVLEAIPEGGRIVPGVPNTVYLALSNRDGDPIDGALIEIGGARVETDRIGLASVQIASGGLQALVRTADGTSATFTKEFEGSAVLLHTDAALVEPGAPVAFEVRSESDGPCRYLVEREGLALGSGSVEVRYGRGSFGWTVPADTPAGLVAVHVFAEDGAHSGRWICVGRTEELSVRVEAAQPSYRPGERVGLEIRVSDSAGRPAAALVGVDVVDTAVLALAKDEDRFSLARELHDERFRIRGFDLPAAVREGKADLARLLLAKCPPGPPPAAAQSDPAVRAAAEAERIRGSALEGALGAGIAIYAGVFGLAFLVLGARANLGALPTSAEDRRYANASRVALYLAGTVACTYAAHRFFGEPRLARIVAGAGSALATIFVPGLWRGFSRLDSARRIRLAALALSVPAGAFVLAAILALPPAKGESLLFFALLAPLAFLAAYAAGIEHRFDEPFVPFYLALVAFSLARGEFVCLLPGLVFAHLVMRILAAGRVLVAFVAFVATASAAMVLFSSLSAQKERSGVQFKEETSRFESGETTPPTEPPRVRRLFPETLAWLPVLWVDESGRAEVEFDGADSITTWRARALASTESGVLGSGTGPVRVFQEFFVRVDPPRWLTRGDRVRVPVSVFNHGSAAREFSLTARAGRGLSLAGVPGGPRTVEAGGVARFDLEVEADRAGSTTLLVEARATDGTGDAVERALAVRPDGRQIERTWSARVSGEWATDVELPAEAIPGSDLLVVRAHVTPVAPAIEGMDALVREPFG